MNQASSSTHGSMILELVREASKQLLTTKELLLGDRELLIRACDTLLEKEQDLVPAAEHLLKLCNLKGNPQPLILLF